MTTLYTKDHEWVRIDGTTATVGITAYAAEQLGDVVFVELPTVGKQVTKGGEAAVVHPSRLGGTRHLSAAQFVHDQRDAVALVASQDGRFTIFCWSDIENMVHAHRVETLLL